MGDVLRERITKVRKALAEGGLSHPANKFRAFALLFSGVQTVDELTDSHWDELFSFLNAYHEKAGAKSLAEYVQDSVGLTEDDAFDAFRAESATRYKTMYPKADVLQRPDTESEVVAEQAERPRQQLAQQSTLWESQSLEQRAAYEAYRAKQKAAEEHETRAINVIAAALVASGRPNPLGCDLLPLDKEMLGFEKFQLLHLTSTELESVALNVERSSTNKEPREVAQARIPYLGTSNALRDATTSVYLEYPENKFTEMAVLFHRYGRDLTVRPKLPARETNKSQELGGTIASLTFTVPDNRAMRNHLEIILGLGASGLELGSMKVHNTKAALSLILLHDYNQEKPLGPEWDSLESKVEMYQKHGLTQLLKVSQ